MLFMHTSKRSTGNDGPMLCRLFEVLGLMVNMKKIHFDSNRDNRVSGISNLLLCLNSLPLPSEKSKKIQLKAQTSEHLYLLYGSIFLCELKGCIEISFLGITCLEWFFEGFSAKFLKRCCH